MKSKFSNLILTTSLSMALSMALCVQAFALSGIQTASVDLSGSKAEILLGNSQIHSAQSASSMISSNGNVKMAVNGAFFDSYSGSSQVYGALIQNGKVINGGGENNMIGFTYDGQALIDRVKISPLVKLQSGKDVTAWGVNIIYSDAKAISVMTDDYDKSFTIPAGAKTFTISGGKVISESSESSQTVQDGTIKVVYNSDALSEYSQWGMVPTVGESATYTHTIAPSSGNSAWANVETAVAGGRILVANGQNVAGGATYNSTITAADQGVDVSAQRSYVYIKGDGKVYFETATGTFNEIANRLVSLGATNAVNLDGGASSMLYNNGSYLTSAGRNLSNILAIVPGGSTSTTTTTATAAVTPVAAVTTPVATTEATSTTTATTEATSTTPVATPEATTTTAVTTSTTTAAPVATSTTSTTSSTITSPTTTNTSVTENHSVTLSTSYDPKLLIIAPTIINSTSIDPVTGAVTKITTDPVTGIITTTVTQ